MGVEEDNVDWKLLKPLFGLSTACKYWYKAIRNFLLNERGGEVTPLAKSVFFRTQQCFEYGYGMGFRDKNTSNLDKVTLEGGARISGHANKEIPFGIIAIHVGDLLISGSEMFTEYITRSMKGEFEADRYEEIEAAYLGMRISKVNSENCDGVISDSNKYEDEINHIGISHESTRAPKEPLMGADRSILRPELGKLMRIARIARPGAIYDESAAAQTFPDRELMDVSEKVRKLWGMKKRKFRKVKRKKILGKCLVLPSSRGDDKRMLTK